MNKKLWLGFYIASFLLFLLAALVVGVVLLLQMDQVAQFSEQTLTLIIALGVLLYLQFVVVQTVYNFVILAKMWGAIQDGVTPITVGKAIGFLFIPFFNLYWIFVAWGGFPTHYNNFIERHQLNAPRLTSAVFTLFPLMILLTGILVLPLLAMPLVFAFVISGTCDAVNELKAAVEEKQTGVVNQVRREPKPKSKLVPAMVAAAIIVPFFLFAAFGVFAVWNMNPKATDAEVPETVGKFKRNYSSAYGSVFGLRSEYSATYKLPDEKGTSDYISYRMIDFTRESDADSRLKRGSYCSDAAKKEGAIKDKNGSQIGEFVLCEGKRLYSKIKNRYVSVDGGYSKFGLNDLVEFFTNLPYNENVDAADLTAALKGSSSTVTTLPKTGGSQVNTVSSGEKADFALTADEFFKDTGGYGATKNREKYAGKTIEISGRYYALYNTGESGTLHAGKNTVNLKIAPDSQSGVASLKTNQRVAFKCRAEGSYSLSLENCLLTSAADALSADDKPDFTFTAQEFYNQVDGNQSYEAKSKKMELYAGKIIELTGKVKQIGNDRHFLEIADMRWITCKPDEENAGQFAALTAGQEVKFKGIGSRTSSWLEHCLVVSP
jgi:hypothetical protein